MQMGRIAIEPTQIGRIDSANRPFRTSVEFTQIRQRRVFRLQSYFCSQMVSGFALVHAHKHSGQNIVNGLSEVLQGFLNLCAADDGGSMPRQQIFATVRGQLIKTMKPLSQIAVLSAPNGKQP